MINKFDTYSEVMGYRCVELSCKIFEMSEVSIYMGGGVFGLNRYKTSGKVPGLLYMLFDIEKLFL